MRVLRLFDAEVEIAGVCSLIKEAPSPRSARVKFADAAARLKDYQTKYESNWSFKRGLGPQDYYLDSIRRTAR